MRILDLFCGGGGAAEGMKSGGHDVVGVDLRPPGHYPGAFVQGDAIEYARLHAAEFDFIWASPPCQSYSRHVTSQSSKYAGTRGKDEPRLIPETRELLIRSGKPWAIENVVSAASEMRDPATLCGVMFGLPIARHRLIETSFFMMTPPHPRCHGVAKTFANERGWEYRDMSVTGKGRHAGTSQRWMEIMGITHKMSQHELRESIPPAYAAYVLQEHERMRR